MKRGTRSAWLAATVFAVVLLLANIPGDLILGPDPLQDGQYGPYWLRTLTGPQWWEWGDLQLAVEVVHSDEIAELPGKSTIKVLRIENVQIDTMPSLDGYHSLQAINMSFANYHSATYAGEGDPPLLPCLRQIARCESIEALNLYDSIVTDRGLKELSRLPKLVHLNLTGNREITDAGLLHLGKLKTLRKLSLFDTAVTQDGVDRLQTELPECEISWNADDNNRREVAQWPYPKSPDFGP